MYYKDLADLIRAKMTENNFSTYEIARRSGGKINANTITRIINGDIKEAKLSTLEAIATAFEMPIEDVIRAVQGKMVQPERYDIYAETFDAHDLSESEWQYLELFFKDHIDRFRAEKVNYRRMIEEQYASGEIDPPKKMKKE